MALKRGYFGKQLRNTWEVSKFRAGEGWLKKIKKKANWTGHILSRNCLLKHVIEGKIKGRIEVMGRRGRRRKKPLDDLTKKR